ncbi:Uma2 family endonuclease [Marinisporobacter balticus]
MVVEVVSPSSRSRDYVQKLDLYMRSGVREY